MMIDLTGIIVQLLSYGFGVAGLVILALIKKEIKNRQMAALLTNVVNNSLGKIQQATDDQISAAAFLHPMLPAHLAVGVQYIIDHAPEALAHFGGISPEMLADKIEAKIGLAAIATNLAITASAAPIVVAPLDLTPSVVPLPVPPSVVVIPPPIPVPDAVPAPAPA